MTLSQRLTSLAQAIAQDIKGLGDRLATTEGSVSSIPSKVENDASYWKGKEGTAAQTIFVQSTDPTLELTVPDGSIWIQI